MNSTFTIASLSYKSQSGARDHDQDIRLDHITALVMADKNTITVKMMNGYSFNVPAPIGIELAKKWEKLATGELQAGNVKITI
jgi:hypothetical protein